MAATLIRLGADVNVRHRTDGATPLIRAVQMSDAALVRVLLAAHANVHVETAAGQTALGEAIAAGHEEIASLLRAAGAGAGPDPIERPSAGVEPARPR
jgi:ankyrin repeat protein